MTLPTILSALIPTPAGSAVWFVCVHAGFTPARTGLQARSLPVTFATVSGFTDAFLRLVCTAAARGFGLHTRLLRVPLPFYPHPLPPRTHAPLAPPRTYRTFLITGCVPHSHTVQVTPYQNAGYTTAPYFPFPILGWLLPTRWMLRYITGYAFLRFTGTIDLLYTVLCGPHLSTDQFGYYTRSRFCWFPFTLPDLFGLRFYRYLLLVRTVVPFTLLHLFNITLPIYICPFTVFVYLYITHYSPFPHSITFLCLFIYLLPFNPWITVLVGSTD